MRGLRGIGRRSNLIAAVGDVISRAATISFLPSVRSRESTP